MAIKQTIRLLASVLLAGLAFPALSAQETLVPTNGVLGAAGTTAPAPAPRLAESPPKAPKVTCVGGQLKISADNSTLGSILSAVHACIGVQIDIPAGAGAQRTFEELGPGSEREVLDALLSGSDFNYVIGASDANPQKVETVLLMERKTELAANTIPLDRTMTPARRAWLESRQNLLRAGTSGTEPAQPVVDESTNDAPAADDTAVAPAQAENASASAAPAQAAASDPPAPAADQPAPAALGSMTAPATASDNSTVSTATNPALDSGKSTAERIADMQQMFEQRKHMAQSQSTTASQP